MENLTFSEALKIASFSPFAKGDGKKIADIISYISGIKQPPSKEVIKKNSQKIFNGEYP